MLERGTCTRFLVESGPIAFAHRGGAGEAPENTLAAFEIAVRLGYRYLETDVHLTRDGVLVAFHDERLDMLTDRTGAIAELGIARVEAADAGLMFSPDGGETVPFRGCGVLVPRLQEILARWPDARVNIDPKSDACVGRLAALLDRLGAWERVCVGSFSDRRLRRIRALGRGRACTSMGPQAVALARLTTASGLMRRLGADCIQVPISRGPIPIVTKRFIAAAHTAGLPVHVWTINDETTINELLDLGVDGIMSDRVRLLKDVLTSRGVGIPPAHPHTAEHPPPAERRVTPAASHHYDRITQFRSSEPRRRCTELGPSVLRRNPTANIEPDRSRPSSSRRGGTPALAAHLRSSPVAGLTRARAEKARYLCSRCRRLPADTAPVRALGSGEGDRAAGLGLTIQIVA